MDTKQSSFTSWIKKNLFSIAVVIVIAIVCCFMLRQRYLAMILDYICIYAIAVTGLDLLFGYTGQVSFGQAGFYALGAYGSAIFSMRFGVPTWISIFIGALIAMVFGFIIAFPASRLVKHFLSLMTIAFGQMVYTFVVATSSLTGGPSGINNIPRLTFFGLSLGDRKVYYRNFFFVAVLLLIVVMIVKHNIIKSRIGRAFIAVRENPHAAAGMGINVAKYKIMAFAISAFLAGLAGALLAHLVTMISPDSFTKDMSTKFMTMLLFGGIGTMSGSVIGAAAITIISELLQSFAAAQMLIYAFIILVVLFFLPNGTVGLIDKLKEAIRKRGKNNRSVENE